MSPTKKTGNGGDGRPRKLTIVDLDDDAPDSDAVPIVHPTITDRPIDAPPVHPARAPRPAIERHPNGAPVAMREMVDRKDILADAARNCRNYGKPFAEDDEEIFALAQSIEDEGLLEPVIVRRNPDADASSPTLSPTTPRFVLVGGYRRIAACDMLGLTLIPCAILPRNKPGAARRSSHADHFATSIVENVQRKDLSAPEFAYALAELRKKFRAEGRAVGNSELARKVGKHPSVVSNYLTCVDCLRPPIAQAWRDRLLTTEKAIFFSRMRPDQQDRAWVEYCGNLPDKRARRVVSETFRPARRDQIVLLRSEAKKTESVVLRGKRRVATDRDRALVRAVLDWVLDRSKPYPIESED